MFKGQDSRMGFEAVFSGAEVAVDDSSSSPLLQIYGGQSNLIEIWKFILHKF